jgi:tetratricopeptide (TPR) repeat protein
MRNIRFWVGLPSFIFLVGCAGFGIVATNDPQVKLSDAEYLYRNEGRPRPAEKLIFEAIEIYQKQNDSQGLGHAYSEYGELLLSPIVATKYEKNYREYGFQDKTVTFENRVAKSKEYFTKALEYYQAAEIPLQEEKHFDKLTNLYYSMAWTDYRLNDRKRSCEFFDKSLAAYTENIRLNPAAKPQVSSGYASPADQIAADKKRMGCE